VIRADVDLGRRYSGKKHLQGGRRCRGGQVAYSLRQLPIVWSCDLEKLARAESIDTGPTKSRSRDTLD